MQTYTQGRDLQLKVSEMWEDPLEWVELLNACAEGASDEPEPAPEPEPASSGVQLSEGVPPASISAEDDLEQLVRDINAARWDGSNDMSDYSVSALLAYLGHQHTVFLVCHDLLDDSRQFLGMASGRLQPKPYANEWWLYVDEVDVSVDHRGRGAGKALMRAFFEIARAADCDVTWLGTEVDNHAANALYRSLQPTDIEQFVGYTFEE